MPSIRALESIKIRVKNTRRGLSHVARSLVTPVLSFLLCSVLFCSESTLMNKHFSDVHQRVEILRLKVATRNVS
jgi:hypothetical protein